MTKVPVRANAAIYFHPDGFDTGVAKLMGRQSAGEGFLRAWARHGGHSRLVCYTDQESHARSFATLAREAGWTGTEVQHFGPAHPEGLATVGTLALPGPDIGRFAWLRRMQGRETAYSIVGITHTTASNGAMDSIGDLLTAPVRPWDALICTSRSVVDTVHTTLSDYMAYLHHRFPGATAPVLPRIAMVPLGVETQRFTADPDARSRWRTELGIGADDIAILFVGRLSFHAKAQIVPFYRALQLAAVTSGKRLHLVEAGWFANDAIRDAYAQAARDYAPNIARHVVDGRNPSNRYSVWQVGDIFCSLSDNIQETFGLTPIEAMAAGLPVVVSDWDGYKDTVRDGVDGFRVPTVAPPPGLGGGLIYRHTAGIDSYDFYCGQTCQFVVVDVEATAKAITLLASDPDLRRRMGDAARTRALAEYDWRHVIGWYQSLYEELAQIRQVAVEPSPQVSPRHPLRADPFHSFRTYPTRHSAQSDFIFPVPGITARDLMVLRAQASVNYASSVLLTEAEALEIINRVVQGPVSVAELVGAAPPARAVQIWRGILWLEKHGLVRTAPAQQP